MIDYILKNKEWIFSGVGVSAIALVFLCFKYFFRRNQPQTEIMMNNTSDHQLVTPVLVGDVPQDKVYQIIHELQQIPPLHVGDIKKHYVGLKVDWLTEYYSAYKKNDDWIRVSLTLITESLRPIDVNCEVKLSEYKQFAILKRGAKVRVAGEIAKFESYSFEISNVMLFF